MTAIPREYRLRTWLAGAAAVLTVVLVIEAALVQRDLTRVLRAAPPDRGAVAVDSTTANGQPRPPVDSYTAMVERPLLIKGRRPSGRDVDGRQSTLTEPAAANIDEQLTAIVKTPTGQIAVFRDRAGKLVRVGLDEKLRGWRLVELTDTVAVLELDQRRVELPLRKPRPPSAGLIESRRAAAATPGRPLPPANAAAPPNPGAPPPQPAGDRTVAPQPAAPERDEENNQNP